MLIEGLNTREKIDTVYHIEIGTITMFETFVVAEIKEGLTIGYQQGEGLLEVILDHFGHSGDFGLICNRIHPFSIVPTELYKIATLFKNNPKVAIVNYTTVGKMSAEFERRFWPFPITLFDELEPAVAWMQSTIKSAC